MNDREFIKLNTSIQTASNSTTLKKNEEGQTEANIELRLPDNLFSTDSSNKKQVEKVEMATTKMRISMSATPLAQIPVEQYISSSNTMISTCQLDVYPFSINDENTLLPEDKFETTNNPCPMYKEHIISIIIGLSTNVSDPDNPVFEETARFNVLMNSNTMQTYSFGIYSDVIRKVFEKESLSFNHLMSMMLTGRHANFKMVNSNTAAFIFNIETLESMFQDVLENAMTFACSSAEIIFNLNLLKTSDIPHVTIPPADANITLTIGDVEYCYYQINHDSNTSRGLNAGFKPKVTIQDDSFSIAYDTASFKNVIPVIWNQGFIHNYQPANQLMFDRNLNMQIYQPPPKRIYKFGLADNSAEDPKSYNYYLIQDIDCQPINIIGNKSIADTFNFLPWIPIDTRKIIGYQHNRTNENIQYKTKIENRYGYTTRDVTTDRTNIAGYTEEVYYMPVFDSDEDERIRSFFPESAPTYHHLLLFSTATKEGQPTRYKYLYTYNRMVRRATNPVAQDAWKETLSHETNERYLEPYVEFVSEEISDDHTYPLGDYVINEDNVQTTEIDTSTIVPTTTIFMTYYTADGNAHRNVFDIDATSSYGINNLLLSQGFVQAPSAYGCEQLMEHICGNPVYVKHEQYSEDLTLNYLFYSIPDEYLHDGGQVTLFGFSEKHNTGSSRIFRIQTTTTDTVPKTETAITTQISNEVSNLTPTDVITHPNLTLDDESTFYLLDAAGVKVTIDQPDPVLIADSYTTYCVIDNGEQIWFESKTDEQELITGVNGLLTPITIEGEKMTGENPPPDSPEASDPNAKYLVYTQTFYPPGTSDVASHGVSYGADVDSYSGTIPPEVIYFRWGQWEDQPKPGIRDTGYKETVINTEWNIGDQILLNDEITENTEPHENFAPLPANTVLINLFSKTELKWTVALGVNIADRLPGVPIINPGSSYQAIPKYHEPEIEYIEYDENNRQIAKKQYWRITPDPISPVANTRWNLAVTNDSAYVQSSTTYFKQHYETYDLVVDKHEDLDPAHFSGNVRLTFTWDNLPVVTLSPIQSIVLTLQGMNLTQEIFPINMTQPSGSSLTSSIAVVENYFPVVSTLRDLHDELIVARETFEDIPTFKLPLDSSKERSLTFSAKYITKDGNMHQLYIPPNGVYTLQLTFKISFFNSETISE